jgi:hypothetical protein
MKFYVEFKNDTDELTLEFETYNTPIAQKWADELNAQMLRNPSLKENNRLYQFPDQWRLEDIVSELKDRADKINSYKFYIPETIDTSINQELLNQLHKYFEEMRGGILSPGEYYLSAPDDIKLAIEDYNVLIHRTEDALNAAARGINRPRIVITFQDRKRYELEDDDYDHFSLDIKFGEVYINYCEVGKPLWDVFKDNDSLVGDQNIRPLKWYSSDMMIYFFNGGYRNRIDNFWSWWDKNNTFLSTLGFEKFNKKLALGHIPVARLVVDKPMQEIINDISKFKNINRVYV